MVNVDVLYKNLSPSEQDAVIMIHDSLGGATKKTVNMSSFNTGSARSAIVSALRLCEVSGMLTKRSKGAGGTEIKVLDQEAFNKLYEMITG